MEDEEKVAEPIVYEDLVDKRNDELMELLEGRSMKKLSERLNEMPEFDVAEFLSSLEDNRMPMLFRLLSKERAAEVFANLEAPDQERIINSITDSELAGIVEELYVDDAVDMMEELPANVVKRVMRTATAETRNLINQYLHYPENSAGSIMTAEFVDLKKYMSVPSRASGASARTRRRSTSASSPPRTESSRASSRSRICCWPIRTRSSKTSWTATSSTPSRQRTRRASPKSSRTTT